MAGGPFQPEFYTKLQYYSDLVERINLAGTGTRVTTVTMALDLSQPDVAKIIKALCGAAKRGAEVMLIVDAFILLEPKNTIPGPLFYRATLPDRFFGNARLAMSAIESIRRAGAKAEMINQPTKAFLNPYAGRSHIKFTLIDDRVYIGGCNLNSQNHIDLMLGWNDAPLSNYLQGLADQMFETGSAKQAVGGNDVISHLRSGVSLLIDAGVPGRSIIQQQAFKLIDEARENIYLFAQYFPTGELSRRLLAARRRGVEITIVYNHPLLYPWPQAILFTVVVAWQHLRLPRCFFKHPVRGQNYLHAKVLATEKASMVGSHNYVDPGVNFGTAEVALLVEGRSFADQLVKAVTSQLDRLFEEAK